MVPNWLPHRLCGKSVFRRGPRRATRRRVRLDLESVEHRVIPSAITLATRADGIPD
jgi:hypothetical protein